MNSKLSRRDFVQAASFSGLLSLQPLRPLRAASKNPSLGVAGLCTENVANPVGVEAHEVRLSWRLTSARRGTRQLAYQLQVASTPERLDAGDADLWNSGRIDSSRSFDIRYAGIRLQSRQQAFWRVHVWDNHGRRATSDIARWEMGLLSASDWHADWLAAETETMRGDRETGLAWLRGEEMTEAGEPRLFRLVFALPEAADVTLFTIAGSSYRVSLDGQAVTLPEFSSNSFGRQGTTSSRHTLAAGDHVLGLSVDQLPQGTMVFGNAGLRCATMVRAQLMDGRVLRFDGRNARTAPGSAAAATAWATAKFDAAGWEKVIAEDRPPAPFPGEGAFLLRREFDLRRRVSAARLYVTALGGYEVHLNGQRVGDDQLAPEFTDFSKRSLYRVHDVSGMVSAGKNAIGAIVGDGWYGSYIAPMGRFGFGPAPLRLIAQLEVRYDNGETEVVTTDGQWEMSRAPITMSEIYDGEDYDARLEQAGWTKSGFTPARPWTPAREGPPAGGRLEGMISPPIRRMQLLPARSITRKDDRQIVDFGQNFAGWARLRVRGQSGERVTLRFAEVLNSDGHIDQSNLRAARAADTYILRGDPSGEIYEPHFTYHGFRYVEVSGVSAELKTEDIAGVVVHSDLPETGRLRIDHPLIMKLWENSRWSERSNFMGIPTDCPQRDERLGWMGDANVFWDAAAFNMDVAAFTERFAGDMRDAQRSDGAFTNVSPDTIRAAGAPGWTDAGVILPWTVWKRYGDTAIIDQHWEAMVRYVEYVGANSPGYLWTKGHGFDFGDWLSLDSKFPGDATTPKDLLATAVFKHSVDAVAEMAEATDRREAAARYRDLAARIRAAFIQAYVQPDGRVSNDSQTAYILALRYDLVPADLRAAAAAKLHANIIRRGNLLTTGFLGTPGSLDALDDAGYAKTVYDLLLRTEYPSWGHMVAKGATTIWERWNGDTGDVAMNSYNHYSLGAVTGFLFRRLAGFEPLEPGFRLFEVNPVLDARVKRGGGEYDSMSGRLFTDWKLGARGKFQITVEVPPNASARIHLPTRDGGAIREGRGTVSKRDDIKLLGLIKGRQVLEVGSGIYRFDVT